MMPNENRPNLYNSFSRNLYRSRNVPTSRRLTIDELNRGQQSYVSTDVNPVRLSPGSLLGSFELAQGSIQSPNYATGSSGWRINSDGSSEFN